MCPCTAQENMGDNSSLFYLDVFSSSVEEMEYSISIEIVPDYFIEWEYNNLASTSICSKFYS